VLIAGRDAEKAARPAESILELMLADYDAAWAEYRALASLPQCPTLYTGMYFNLPGQPPVDGLHQSVAEYRRSLRSGVCK